MQSATKLKKIIQDSEETVVESDVQSRMQPLKDLLTKTIDHLYTVFEVHVFIAICRCYWDRMGQVSCICSTNPKKINQICKYYMDCFFCVTGCAKFFGE